MNSVITVINYSSLDNLFIRHVIKEANKFSKRVIVVSWDRFFDGTPDDKLFIDLQDCNHVILPFGEGHPTRYYHNHARYTGYQYAKDDSNSILFLDGDEVPEGDRFKDFIATTDLRWDYKIANYWYYRDTCYQATKYEDSAVLVNQMWLPDVDFYQEPERHSLSDMWIREMTYSGKPLIHHYSWAKPKETLYKKVSTWGHKSDAVDWVGILDQEFSREFNYRCPFNNYGFIDVEPYINYKIGQ